MKFFDQLRLIERVDGLIRRKQTGSPKELARKLGVSTRTVHRIVADMRDMGLPIDYSSATKNYYYESDVVVHIEISRVDQEKMKGGENVFGTLTDFGTVELYLSAS